MALHMLFGGALLAASAAAASPRARAVPTPVALWALQEATGSPRLSTGGNRYALMDGNASAPIERVSGGVLGPFSAHFSGALGNNTQRLYAPREAVPALAAGIAGPKATVTLVTWIKRSAADAARSTGGMIAGVWEECGEGARQYATFTNLGTCTSYAPVYHGGLAAHISPNGGPTPGNKYCITAACDPLPLPTDAWHCLATAYNGTHILAYLNATVHDNGSHDPYPLEGGIFSPEAAGRPGAELGVGANRINTTVGGAPLWSNQFVGQLGGLAVWDSALAQEQIAAVCGAGAGFESQRAAGEAAGWRFAVPQ